MFSRQPPKTVGLFLTSRRGGNFLHWFCNYSSDNKFSAADGQNFQQKSQEQNLPAEVEQKFERIKPHDKRKEELISAIEAFAETRGKHGGYVEFIENIRQNLKNINLHKDLDVYKALLRVFPEGKLIPKNVFQQLSYHYPVQQATAVQLLDQMEWFQVYPDKEVYDIMVSRFGVNNWATGKIKRELYWLPKLVHTNKYLDRRTVERQNLNGVELARKALEMICRDAGTHISYVKASIDGSWILSAQSALQKRIVRNLPRSTTCYVDGPSRVWVMDRPVKYMMLSTAPSPDAVDEVWRDQREVHDFSNAAERIFDFDDDPRNPKTMNASIHHQTSETILSLAVLERNTQQNAESWVADLIAKGNPRLGESNILFRIEEPVNLYPWGQ